MELDPELLMLLAVNEYNHFPEDTRKHLYKLPSSCGILLLQSVSENQALFEIVHITTEPLFTIEWINGEDLS